MLHGKKTDFFVNSIPARKMVSQIPGVVDAFIEKRTCQRNMHKPARETTCRGRVVEKNKKAILQVYIIILYCYMLSFCKSDYQFYVHGVSWSYCKVLVV